MTNSFIVSRPVPTPWVHSTAMRSSTPPVPLGILAEVVAAHGLLIGAEAAMVGRGGLQIARPAGRATALPGAPSSRKGGLITWAAAVVPVGMAIDGIVDQQMARQHLAIDPLALEPGAGDGLQRLLAGIVDDVERGVDHLGQADDAVGGLALDLRRARERMALGAGDALLQQLLLQEIDELAVLGMDGRRARRAPGSAGSSAASARR